MIRNDPSKKRSFGPHRSRSTSHGIVQIPFPVPAIAHVHPPNIWDCRLEMARYLVATRRKFWSGARDLNPGPHGPEPCALPNCASPRRESDSIGALRQTLTARAPHPVSDPSRFEVGRGGPGLRTSLGNRLPVREREAAGCHHCLPEWFERRETGLVLLPVGGSVLGA